MNVEVIPARNEQILHLFDASSYTDNLGVSCGRLEITVPGFRNERLVEPNAYFNIGLNAISLELIHEATPELPPLPDGIYHIKYSISPNQLVFVEMDHLRTTMLDNMLFKARYDLNMTSCTPDEAIKKKLIEIRMIEDYIRAAVAAVEICEDPEKGTMLLQYATQLMDKYLSIC